MNFTMMPTEATPRYRNFSNNMPTSVNPTPRAVSSLITVEKEPERDPEEDCFMCRQANVYVKPIGVSQERRVARRQPPPLSRAQIEQLSRKSNLTKQEARKLLQCFFPEIKTVKSFQLHKYHSCCYDPKHIKLCKNHITALQYERDFDDIDENDPSGEKKKPSRVSFVRIKIEPTQGIPTRFLGPAILPESLADMLIKQVNRLEHKPAPKPLASDYGSMPYGVRRIRNPYSNDDDNSDDDDDDEDDDDEPLGQIEGSNRTVGAASRRLKDQATGDSDLVVEDIDELNRRFMHPDDAETGDENDDQQEDDEEEDESAPRKPRKKGTKKNRKHRKPKLKHWEIMALEQKTQDRSCNCRHHVMRLAADQIVYDWCRCKDHQHKEVLEKHKPPTPPPPPPEPPRDPTPPPRPKPKPKPPKIKKKSVGINATEQPNMTELALAYDPSAVDYDMISEAIYYRTSSGRLIKPEVSNAFTYESVPPTMSLRQRDTLPTKNEVLYLSSNGQVQEIDDGQRRSGKANYGGSTTRSVVVSNPGTLYDGQVIVDPDISTPRSNKKSTLPVLKLPASLTSSKMNFSDTDSKHGPTEYTIAQFSSGQSIGSSTSRRTTGQSPFSGSQGKGHPTPRGNPRSTKPTYSNLEPTPDFGRQSSVIATRRWFDQPLGDQNLRPVHDGQYGLIAGSSAEEFKAKSERASAPMPILSSSGNPENFDAEPKNMGSCVIS